MIKKYIKKITFPVYHVLVAILYSLKMHTLRRYFTKFYYFFFR